jgi:hypothetical protein
MQNELQHGDDDHYSFTCQSKHCSCKSIYNIAWPLEVINIKIHHSLPVKLARFQKYFFQGGQCYKFLAIVNEALS